MSQVYRCEFKRGGFVDVLAETGDEASVKALTERPGEFVAAINPAPANVQPHLKGKINDGGATASELKALGEDGAALLKQMAA